MRLLLVLVAAICSTAPAMAQDAPASPAGSATSSAQDTGSDLPVSLDRIREGLKKPQESRLRNLDVKPDFSVQVEEQRRIDEIMSKLDFKSGPAPAGGLYGYDQQRRLFNPTDRPLQQPYAAFSGGEFITIAIENLIRNYLRDPVANAVKSAERSHAETRAREEVDQSVAEYCAGRPDRENITLCNKN
jgi:hypothetical protein